MRSLGLTSKFFLPVGIVLTIVIAALVWGTAAYQTHQAEHAFEDRLSTLAVASRSMIHSAAEDYCRSVGMEFHRLEQNSSSLSGFERSAFKAFGEDPKLESRLLDFQDKDGVPRMHVLAPARLKEDCTTCHGAYGLDLFKDRKVGDLVPAPRVNSKGMPSIRSAAMAKPRPSRPQPFRAAWKAMSRLAR